MAIIHNTHLEIIPVENRAGERLLRVTYDLTSEAGDDLVGATISETIRVRGRDLHDAPVFANSEPFAIWDDTFALSEGTSSRTLEQTVHRFSLDVEQDWWSSGEGGETQAIAEWVDHIVAEIELTHNDELLDQATTPVVTGSWGALGTD